VTPSGIRGKGGKEARKAGPTHFGRRSPKIIEGGRGEGKKKKRKPGITGNCQEGMKGGVVRILN